MCVCVLDREGERVRKSEGEPECVCEDLMVKKVANVVILNSLKLMWPCCNARAFF